MMRLISFMVGILATAVQALSQDFKPPTPVVVGNDKSTAWQWLITTVLLVGCLVVAFKPAKRSKLE